MNAPDDSLWRAAGLATGLVAFMVHFDRPITKSFWIGAGLGAVGILLLHLVCWVVRKAKKKANK